MHTWFGSRTASRNTKNFTPVIHQDSMRRPANWSVCTAWYRTWRPRRYWSAPLGSRVRWCPADEDRAALPSLPVPRPASTADAPEKPVRWSAPGYCFGSHGPPCLGSVSHAHNMTFAYINCEVDQLTAVQQHSCAGLFMVALWNTADHYMIILSFVLLLPFFFFSSPNLSRRRLDVCHTSTHGVALVWI